MPPLENEFWLDCLECLDYAFQPIVNIHTGMCYGYEAQLRNTEAAGIESIGAFFDRAFEAGVLHQVDRKLRTLAITKLSDILANSQTKLFFNLDNRLLGARDYRTGFTLDLLLEKKLSPECLCMEVSEKHRWNDPISTMDILNTYRCQGFKIAVDDFGAGFSGLQMIYYLEPDFIKIDRFFIQDLCNDPKKRMFVTQIVNISHLLGSIVIAEGVETENEYFACLAIGCDLIQGYLVQKPRMDTDMLQREYEHVRILGKQNLRASSSHEQELICSQIELIEPILLTDSVSDVFDRFRTGRQKTLFPVVNARNEPLGVIRENSIKEYAYSKYGRDLLQNPRFSKNILQFVTRFPIADIHISVEKILEIYSQNENIEGILMVDSMQYQGFLSAPSLLKALNEKNLVIARDQNPLSRLPGNTLINEYVSRALQQIDKQYILVWFDFDHFKPYNDTYGFRNGDRLILRFSELMKSVIHSGNRFIGHIGGDDFFMGAFQEKSDDLLPVIHHLLTTFRKDAESFYDAQAILQGAITAKGRDGLTRQYPLISVSAVVLDLPATRSRSSSPEDLSRLMGQLKSRAKASPDKRCVYRLPDDYQGDFKNGLGLSHA
ncbi:MAG: EAL domain-containing protein [Desulfatirhabdiaceae bacterium]